MVAVAKNAPDAATSAAAVPSAAQRSAAPSAAAGPEAPTPALPPAAPNAETPTPEIAPSAAPTPAPAQDNEFLSKVGGFFNSFLDNPLLEGGAAITTAITGYANIPVIGSIIGGLYAIGHLFRFLGDIFQGKLDMHALRELAGFALTGGAAIATLVCPELSMLNGVALTGDMALTYLDQAGQSQQPSFTPAAPDPAHPNRPGLPPGAPAAGAPAAN